jgi:hypothetical protein
MRASRWPDAVLQRRGARLSDTGRPGGGAPMTRSERER